MNDSMLHIIVKIDSISAFIAWAHPREAPESWDGDEEMRITKPKGRNSKKSEASADFQQGAKPGGFIS